MSNEQPLALRLAASINNIATGLQYDPSGMWGVETVGPINEAAAELRRLHAVKIERDGLMSTFYEELDAGFALRDLGGATSDEDMDTFLRRVIAERDQLRAAAQQDEPVAWMDSPHGAIRANPVHRWSAPQSVDWSIPLYTAMATTQAADPIAWQQPLCRYISDVLASDAAPSEKHIARTIMHLLPIDALQPAPVAQPTDWLHEVSVLAGMLMTDCGIAHDASTEPGADRLRDKLAARIQSAFDTMRPVAQPELCDMGPICIGCTPRVGNACPGETIQANDSESK